jgi:hypothetical protein
MTAESVARSQYADRARLAKSTTTAATSAWRQLDPSDLDAWRQQQAELAVVVAGAQQTAARDADDYLTAVLDAQDINPTATGRVWPGAFAGVASDGRDLVSLLGQPTIATKLAIATGAPINEAMATGLAVLQMIVGTQVADAGRVADATALAARPHATGYVRMVVGKTCARCAILAGRWYQWSTGFRRHPKCDCIHIPSREAIATDLRLNPRALVDAGRVTGLSRAAQEAIGLGADPAQVVNANRGMYTAGGKRLTREGTSRRGLAGPGVRLMPEQILRDASNRDDAVRQLREHSFIL